MTAIKQATALPHFTKYPSYKLLKELAKSPYDLTKNLSQERIEKYSIEVLGMKLLYATERVDDHVLRALSQLAEESSAVQKMYDLQKGQVINLIQGYPSDNRSVLHTAMRDLFDNSHLSPLVQEAVSLVRQEHTKLKSFLERIDSQQQFEDLVMIGIGGSDLGPRALYLSLQAIAKKNRRVHFISNVDPDDAASVLQNLNLQKTLFVVVSKSGTTLETLTNEEFVRKKLREASLDPSKHIVSVTAKGGPLDNTSSYIECFHMWDYVGGRFSSTSMVGGVLLSFGLGYEVYLDILKGAHAMDKIALEEDIFRNFPLFNALIGIWNHNFLGYSTCAVVPYSQALMRFPAHLQQCDMESNGKHIDKFGNSVDFETGPIIWGEPGTNVQHSFFQLLHQGTPIVPIEFIGFKHSQYGEDLLVKGTTSQEKLNANLFAQAIALATGQKSDNPNKSFPGNRPSHILLCHKLTPFTLGALLSYYEHKVAFQGFIWNINSFDQEGVQLGKVLADRLLQILSARRKGDNSKDGSFSLGEAMMKHLDGI